MLRLLPGYPASAFQLHVMDSYNHVDTTTPELIQLSTPCNGFRIMGALSWYITLQLLVLTMFSIVVPLFSPL